MKYSFDDRVRFSECGADTCLTMEGIINYFQDAATFHGEDTGRSAAYLQSHNQAWLLTKWQIHVERYPRLGERLRIITWPYAFQGFLGYRNFELETPEGERLAWADSLWIFMDMLTMKPVRVTQDTADAYGMDMKLDMDYASGKLKAPAEGGVHHTPILIRREHIDFNGHVNNGRYVELAMDYLPKGVKPKEMLMDYRSQAHLGDTLDPVIYAGEHELFVSLQNAEGLICTLTKFTY